MCKYAYPDLIVGLKSLENLAEIINYLIEIIKFKITILKLIIFIYIFFIFFCIYIIFIFLCLVHLDPKPQFKNPMISTVLIVEDEPILAIALKSLLQSIGYQVIGTARTSKDAVAKTYLYHPDLIVMDINLADEKTGLDAAEEIREFSQSPIVFQTASQEISLLSRAKNFGHSTVLSKTLSQMDWMEAIFPFQNQLDLVA